MTEIYFETMSFLAPANEVWGKVIFLHLSVILFTGWEYVLPPDRYTPPVGTHTPPGRYTPRQCMLADTGNKRAVRILLECILVDWCEEADVIDFHNSEICGRLPSGKPWIRHRI